MLTQHASAATTMSTTPTPVAPARDEGYAQAHSAWQQAFDRYLHLARAEAGAAKLRVAAAAVHAAALRRGRLTSRRDDAER